MPWQPCSLADLVQRPFAGTTTWPCEPVTYQGDLPLPLPPLPCPPWLPAHCPSSTRPRGSGRGLKPPPDGHQPHQGPARVVDLGPGTLHIATLLTGLEVLPPASVCHLSGQQEVTGPGDLCTGSPAETEDRAITLGGVPAPPHPGQASSGNREGGGGPLHSAHQSGGERDRGTSITGF